MSRVSSLALRSIGLTLAVALPTAWKSDEPAKAEGEPKTEAKADEASKTAADGGKVADAPPPKDGGLTKTVVAEVKDAATGGRLDRGNALGHFLLPNPSALLADVRTKVAPAKNAGFIDEQMLRSLAGMQLGARSGLAQHLSLSEPMGCVLVDDAAVEVPVACVMGYTGGAAAVAADLGADGKQADAQGHVAYYRVEGNDVFIDDLGSHVVITNSGGLYAKAKDYVSTNMVGRAAGMKDDIEVVAYPGAAMTRYSKQIDMLTSLVESAPTPPTGNPVTDAFTEYTRTSMDRSFDFYRETEQFELAASLEDLGLVIRYAAYPAAGSGMQADAQAISAGPIDPTLVKQLPAESWLVSAYTLDWQAAWNMESMTAMRDVLLDAYAQGVGRDAAEVKLALAAFITESADLYGKDLAMGVAYLPGTQGGIIVSRKASKPGRASWKAWSEGFTAEKVLGVEGAKHVTWSFSSDALTVDGVAVDRWTIEPGPEGKAKIAAKADPVVAEIERRFGGLKLEIDRVELDDRVLFVIAPGAQEAYVRSAITAAKGGASLGSDAGFTTLLARNPETSALMALDVAGMLTWAREVLPPDATAKIPPGVGNDLSDFYFAVTYGASGSQRGEMVMSQALIDQLRALAG